MFPIPFKCESSCGGVQEAPIEEKEVWTSTISDITSYSKQCRFYRVSSLPPFLSELDGDKGAKPNYDFLSSEITEKYRNETSRC